MNFLYLSYCGIYFDVHVGSKPVTLNFVKCFRNCYKLIFEMLKLQGNILSVYQLYYKPYSVLQIYSTWTFCVRNT